MTCPQTPATSAAPSPRSTAATATPAASGYTRVSGRLTASGRRWNVCALLSRATGVWLPSGYAIKHASSDVDSGEVTP